MLPEEVAPLPPVAVSYTPSQLLSFWISVTFSAAAGTASEPAELPLLEVLPEPEPVLEPLPELLLLELLLEPELLLELPLPLELPLLPELELLELEPDPEPGSAGFSEPPVVTALEAIDGLSPPQPARKIGTDTRVKFTTAKMKTFFLKILIFLPGLAMLQPDRLGIIAFTGGPGLFEAVFVRRSFGHTKTVARKSRS